MPADMTLAQLSNVFVYASMGVFAASFIAFAASLAAGRGRDQFASEQEESRTLRIPEAKAIAATVGASAKAKVQGASAVAPPPSPVKNSRMVSGTKPKEQHSGGSSGEPTEELDPGRRSGNIGLSLMWLATLLLTFGVLARGISAGRPPWGNMYEFSVASALAVSLFYLIISLKRDIRWLGVFITGAILLTLGTAVTLLYTESAQLVPALKSYWLAIHVSAAIISAGAFTFGAFVTGLYLVRDRAERKAEGGEVVGWLATRVPSAARLDSLAYRINAFVFPLWTFAVIAGAIWAENAWGRYWGWDPKETWAFITWVVYAGYLHARATVGWRGRKAAFICLLGYGCFLFNYFGVNIFVSGLHSYAGVK